MIEVTPKIVEEFVATGTSIYIDYTNWRGVRGTRNIVPQKLYEGEVEWHPGAQLLLDAWDIDKGAVRTFAVGDVKAWSETPL